MSCPLDVPGSASALANLDRAESLLRDAVVRAEKILDAL